MSLLLSPVKRLISFRMRCFCYYHVHHDTQQSILYFFLSRRHYGRVQGDTGSNKSRTQFDLIENRKYKKLQTSSSIKIK